MLVKEKNISGQEMQEMDDSMARAILPYNDKKYPSSEEK